jgi:signal transduction histidine kinase
MLTHAGRSQDTTVTLAPGMLLLKEKVLPLQFLDGWIFRKGNDLNWAKKNIDITGWEKRKPVELSEKLADENGKLECWLRIKIKMDTAFRDTPFDLFVNGWAATDVYVDGVLFNSYGNTGSNGKPFKEYNRNYKSPLAFTVDRTTEHVIAVHFVDFVSSFPPYHLRSEQQLKYFIALMLPERTANNADAFSKIGFYQDLWLSINTVMCLLFWLLAFQNAAEKNLWIIAITSTLLLLLICCDVLQSRPDISYNVYGLTSFALSFILPLTTISILVLITRIFKRKMTLLPKVLLLVIFATGISPVFFENDFISTIQIYLSIMISAYYVITSWRTLKGAQWAVVGGILVATGFGCLLVILTPIWGSVGFRLLTTGTFLAFPLSLIVYVTMRFKEIIKETQQNAKQVVKLSEEKKGQALNQQKILQEEVNRQTSELRNTLDNLKATQAQLIQSEKMASLGELTAGIAHEIQNPLNFVNNFSEVNKELLTEMKDEIDKGNVEDAKAIANDVIENQEKINLHGKRADSIVKGMLQHSRASSGQKEPTDINKLADEYLRLSYHGMRARDKSFKAEMKTDFDESLSADEAGIGKINVVPQDIGRVLLNLLNNAFYAVSERQKVKAEGLKAESSQYVPTVTIVTKKLNDKVEVIVKDNGIGISRNIIDKIFQPFFTTKPTGQGTGLGLSLAYDIIKAHGGAIKVETKEGEGSEFIVQLPV